MESVGRAAQKYVIVLDPGHGGYDGGAENQNGISSESESKLTLKIANYVKQELEKSSQFVVYMTRTDDSYVGLSERVNYAASKNADILVSLHLNSADSKTANGAEILVRPGFFLVRLVKGCLSRRDQKELSRAYLVSFSMNLIYSPAG